jgi:hypothetical protein
MDKHIPGVICVIILVLVGVVAATLIGGCTIHRTPEGAPTTSVQQAGLSRDMTSESGEAMSPEAAEASGTITLKDAIERWVANEQARKADLTLQKARTDIELLLGRSIDTAAEGQ